MPELPPATAVTSAFLAAGALATSGGLPAPVDVDAGLDTDIDLTEVSDGRDWASATVLREIRHYQAAGVMATFEIGRRLIWSRQHLGHGAYQEWASANLDMSAATRRRATQLAAYLIKHPKMRAQLDGMSVQKVLLLTSLPESDQVALAETGMLSGGVSLVEAATMPYEQLRQRLEKAEKQLEGAQNTVKQLEGETKDLKVQLHDAKAPRRLGATERITGDTERLERLRSRYMRVRVAFMELVASMDEVTPLLVDDREATAVGETRRVASDELHTEAALVYEGLPLLAEHLRARFRHLVGDAVADAEYVEALRRANALPEGWAPDVDTTLPGYDAEPVAEIILPLKGGKPGPRVVR